MRRGFAAARSPSSPRSETPQLVKLRRARSVGGAHGGTERNSRSARRLHIFYLFFVPRSARCRSSLLRMKSISAKCFRALQHCEKDAPRGPGKGFGAKDLTGVLNLGPTTVRNQLQQLLEMKFVVEAAGKAKFTTTVRSHSA